MDFKSQLRSQRDALIAEGEALCQRAQGFNRDLSSGEKARYDEITTKVDAYNERLRSLEEEESRNAEMAAAMAALGAGPTSTPVIQQSLERFAEMLRNREAGSVEIRALTTTISGARTDVWSANLGLDFIHRALGIPEELLADSLTYQAPKWGALAAQAATGEGAAFPTLTDPTLSTASLARYGRYMVVSDEALRFGTTLSEIGQRLTDEVVNDVNTAVVNALEAAAVAQAFAVSAAQSLDTAIAKVRAATGAATGVLVNPADYYLFSAKTGADSGDDIGSQVVAWNGVPLVPHDAVDAGFATVVSGRAFKLIGTALDLQSVPELATGQIAARSRMHATLSASMAGNVAIKADIITP
ncbi:MAG TPA: hypothetical protein VNT31_01725 [Nocardioides sp.]|nr:hypothetical protein [Nocardioides sp.]